MPSSEACWGGRSISRISTQRAHTDPPNELEPATETIVLDARDLKTIRERFRQINNERLKRVVAALHGPQRDFLSLLPLLFHTNHPMLPGFAGKSVPFGLAEYAPTNSTLNAARRLTRSFEFKRRAGRSVDILALYLMGSSGTVAYSRKSDFDVWVCHRDELSAEAVGELTRKTDAIAQWAETLGLEVHFFNLSAKAFGAGKDEALSSESSGSAQHYLLLDEFYRTALLVSGRYPAWWLVPPQYERQYHAVVETIRERRLCGDNEFIDFGTVSELPASEFVGAALWQLTKAIESPHKSLLKIMLIEAYASEFPDPDLLSNRFKRAVYDGERSLNRLDPYAVFVQKVEDYLRVAHDDDRLELARQCFYLKVNVPLSKATARATTDWRVELVQEVVDEWDWDDEKIAKLDNRSSWRIGEVMDERNAMVRALIHAYKFIARFSRKQSETQGVSERDMTILGRKLFAAFEQKAGKINIVNRGLENDLSEPRITVVRTASASGRDVWAVYRGTPDTTGDIKPFKRTGTLVELLTWCYFNGVLDRNTRVKVHQADVKVSARDIETLHTHLRTQFPPDSTRLPDVEEVARSPQLIAASTFVNLGIDPMQSYTRQGKSLTSSHADALSYGGKHEILVEEIDYLVLTSWREVLSLKFKGMSGLLDALCEHLRWAERGRRDKFPSVPCNCFTPEYAHAITLRISVLFNDVTAWHFEDQGAASRVYIIKGGDRFYALAHNGKELTAEAIGVTRDLFAYLGRAKDQYTSVTLDSFALTGTPLALVYSANKGGQINCNYFVENKVAQLYVTDENGALFHVRAPFHTDATLVRPLRTFFESVQYRQSVHAKDVDIKPPVSVTFHRITRSADRGFHQKPVDIDVGASSNTGFDIQVIGEQIDGATQFTLFCEGMEFSTLDHGDRVFEALARHIVGKRHGGGRYPIFITDIDLSRMSERSGSLPTLQTIHYLHYKKRIEERLNAEIPRVSA